MRILSCALLSFCRLLPAVNAAGGAAHDSASSVAGMGAKVRLEHTQAASGPTFADVPYGDHPRQKMDFWQAASSVPSPVVFYIHGGGWNAEDKGNIHEHLNVAAFMAVGISVVAVNYRLLKDANAAGVSPPVEWPLGDARRALQFVRHHAGEWGIDKQRIGATGVSAGGCTSLWLALHDDMAEPHSPDPVARESTRLHCAAVKAAVTSLDPQQLRAWIPNSIFGAHAFGFADMSRPDSFPAFLAARDSHLPQIRRFSPIEFVSSDDPPIFMEYPMQDRPPVPGEFQTDPTHSAVQGLMLQRKLDAQGVEVELRYRGDGKVGHEDVQHYLMEALRGAPAMVQPKSPAPP